MSLSLVCGVLVGAALLCRPRRALGLNRRARSAPVRTSTTSAASVARLVRRVRRRDPAGTLSTTSALRLIDDLAMQVRAGATPAQAWQVAVELIEHDAWERLTAAPVSSSTSASTSASTSRVASGERPPGPGESARETLHRLSLGRRANPALLGLQAAWSLCDDVGAPLAPVLTVVAEAVRQDADVEADIEAALAAPRATARLLAVLPLGGIALGELIGAHPLHVLLHTTLGRWCAVGGLVLAVCGQWWTSYLVTRTAARL